MKIAAISRNPADSPHMKKNDEAILQSTAEMLRTMGAEVNILDEKDDFSGSRYNAILHMSRTASTLEQLQKIPLQDTQVTNNIKSVQNCSRLTMMQILSNAGIRQPSYIVISTESNPPQITYPVWLKKADGWSAHPDDVCYIQNKTQLLETLTAYRNRNISKAVCCQHIEGDIIKFYGVKGGFFHYSYPNPEKTKFGLEKINGNTRHLPFDKNQLKQLAFSAAAAIGLEIFGGDGIITPQNNIYIIDLNDFPSFSCCRKEAAQAIANLIFSKVKP